MKVAINALILDDKKAGIGNYAYHLLREMAFLVENTEVHMYVYLQDCMVSLYTGKLNVHPVSCGNFKSGGQRILFEQLRLPRLIKNSGCSLTHYLDFSTPVFPSKGCSIVTIHDLSYYIYPECFTFGSRLFKQSLTDISLARAERVICVSQNTKHDVCARFQRLSQEKIIAIPLGVEKKALKEAEPKKLLRYLKEKGINGKYILYIGTLEPRKNTALLIRAYSRLVERTSLPHQLLICGKPGWKYEGIYEAARQTGLKDRICFAGYAPQELLPLIYRNAEVFVYPSLYEGFGLPPLEAMAWGTPVITSNAASLPEAVGSAALTFDPMDEEALAFLMTRVLTEDGLRDQLIKAGYLQAEKFCWRQTAARTLMVYRELMSEVQLG